MAAQRARYTQTPQWGVSFNIKQCQYVDVAFLGTPKASGILCVFCGRAGRICKATRLQQLKGPTSCFSLGIADDLIVSEESPCIRRPSACIGFNF
eukprot:scaffold652344_cov31-Prasinocladus_malaysianus.AAC.2